ncbi:hypothetical protein T07_627, partial [Trichinella nelsoni]
FWKVPRHTNAYVSNKWPLCCHVPILIHREVAHLKIRFQHYNEVFVESAKFCETFRSFGQVDFPSFSVHFTLIKERIFDEMGSEFVRFLQ